MITIIPLKESPGTWTPPREDPAAKKLTNCVVVFSRKNTPKIHLQIRMNFVSHSGPHAELVNLSLSGEEAMKIADALVRKSIG
jgi:RecB family endonuclease NucS